MEIALLNDFHRSVKSVMTVALANGARRISHGKNEFIAPSDSRVRTSGW